MRDLLATARRELASGRLDAAERRLRPILQRAPEHVQALQLLVDVVGYFE